MRDFKWLIDIMIKEGNILRAIRIVKQITGLGLKESKYILDNWDTVTKLMDMDVL